ncbi:metalloregulator ArsR/SmtB family transcription factor [Christensenellaceae bacterium OttesenSCG-928-K19]|nr:metalloregulator ArsR/SmtB family transcription factor [Christensenellaceae bacterium OttesenSCG-928-K19]
MEREKIDYIVTLKALAEPTRLQIVQMLSDGDLCACVIQEKFDITQPTLSHHMRILCDSNVVIPRKEGKWTYYTQNADMLQAVSQFINILTISDRNQASNE